MLLCTVPSTAICPFPIDAASKICVENEWQSGLATRCVRGPIMRPAHRILAACTAFTVATIAYVHYSQAAERERMREAVLRDIASGNQ